MANHKSEVKTSLIKLYQTASILVEMKEDVVLTDIFRKTRIEYNTLRTIVDGLEEKGYIKTVKNGNETGKPRKIIYVDSEIKRKANELIKTYNKFSDVFNGK